MTKLIVAFRNFANAPGIEWNILGVRALKDLTHVGLLQADPLCPLIV